MLALLEEYPISQIIIFVIVLIVAIKSVWEVVDFFKNKYSIKFNKDYDKKSGEEKLQVHYTDCKNQHQETLDMYNSLESKIDDLTDTIHVKFDELDKRMDQLNENDKHSIKQSIVKDYHYFVENKGWIDDFSLDTILLLFDDYKELGGNSYIASLVDELKKLPKQPPQK